MVTHPEECVLAVPVSAGNSEAQGVIFRLRLHQTDASDRLQGWMVDG